MPDSSIRYVLSQCPPGSTAEDEPFRRQAVSLRPVLLIKGYNPSNKQSLLQYLLRSTSTLLTKSKSTLPFHSFYTSDLILSLKQERTLYQHLRLPPHSLPLFRLTDTAGSVSTQQQASLDDPLDRSLLLQYPQHCLSTRRYGPK